MKIAVTHQYSTIIGGAEHAVSSSIMDLIQQGHELVFIHEDEQGDGQPVAPAGLLKSMRLADRTAASVFAHLARWRPDIVFNHGLHGPEHLRQMQQVAPTVSYVHDYVGACISGTKLHQVPVPTLCTRSFGPGCLAHYLPRRCGGKHPLTMVKLFNHNLAMQQVLMQDDAIILASEHMAQEWRRLGYPVERLHVISPYCGELSPNIDLASFTGKIAPGPGEGLRIAFLGRMEPLKGGTTLIAALQLVRKALNVPVQLTLAGNGRARADWEARAAAATAADAGLSIHFPGHINATQREALLDAAHLLVMPSVWPEPFGQVGVQAHLHGVPTVAFNSGGAPDWLQHGVNGLLADSTPPNAANLAKAIIEVFADAGRYRRMSLAGPKTSARFAREEHFGKLNKTLASVIENPRRLLR